MYIYVYMYIFMLILANVDRKFTIVPQVQDAWFGYYQKLFLMNVL